VTTVLPTGIVEEQGTMIAAEPHREVYGMIIFGLSSDQWHEIYGHDNEDESLASADAEIILDSGEKMLVEVGFYLWMRGLDRLVALDKEPSLQAIQERYWYRFWMSAHIDEEERELKS
jgi:hypothetical protein